eukprot:4645533-Prymnesium_polylepis.1
MAPIVTQMKHAHITTTCKFWRARRSRRIACTRHMIRATRTARSKVSRSRASFMCVVHRPPAPGRPGPRSLTHLSPPPAHTYRNVSRTHRP